VRLVTRPTRPSRPVSADWLDRLAHRAARADADVTSLPSGERIPSAGGATGHLTSAPHDHLSRRSILQKGLLAAGLTVPLRLIAAAPARAAGCVQACTARAVKNYKASEKLAASLPQSNHPQSTTLEALNGTLLAASIRADADAELVSALRKCDEPNCGKGSAKACGPCKAGAPGFHCCLCTSNFDSGSGEPNPVVLANFQTCASYCDLFHRNSIVSDTAC
jgi:hypothetical protein